MTITLILCIIFAQTLSFSREIQMADSLIKIILLQANKLNAKMEDFVELNELLRSETTGHLWNYQNLVGLGRDKYNLIKDSFVFDKALIVGINEDNLIQHANGLKSKIAGVNDQTMAYQAAICFALVAVYGHKVSNKLQAYGNLAFLYKSHLRDRETKQLCDSFCAPIAPQKEVLIPTSRIVWSWVTSIGKVFEYETNRHQVVLGKPITMSIKKAHFLLGLNQEEGLDKEKIKEAAQYCREKLKSFSKRSDEELNTLLKNFEQAEKQLLDYVQFMEFDKQQTWLKSEIDKIQTLSIPEQNVFMGAQKVLFEQTLFLQKIVSSIAVEAPYVTPEIIQQRLGSKDDPMALYPAQQFLVLETQRYWRILANQCDSLVNESQSLPDTIDALTAFCNRLESLLAIVDDLESKRDIAVVLPDLSQKKEKLFSCVAEVKQKLERRKQEIKNTLNSFLTTEEFNLSELHPVTNAAEVEPFIQQQKNKIQQIEDKLKWISSLKEQEKRFAQECCPSKFDNLANHLGKIKSDIENATKNTIADLNRNFKDTADRHLKDYDELLLAIKTPRTNLPFAWLKNLRDLSDEARCLHSAYSLFRTQFPATCQNQTWVEPDVVERVTAVEKKKEDVSTAMATFKKQMDQSNLDDIKYLWIKKRLKQEIAVYMAKGNHHHPDRLNSLKVIEECMAEYEKSTAKGSFAYFINNIKNEKAWTALSHQKIGFLGHFRPCRLQNLYTNIISESNELEQIFLINNWDNFSLSKDALQYMVLRNSIQQELTTYEQGTHHQDRYNSIQLIKDKIKELDKATSDNRFDSLLAIVKEEEGKTVASHHRIGFLSNWRPCRLQGVYAKVQRQATFFESIADHPEPMNEIDELANEYMRVLTKTGA